MIWGLSLHGWEEVMRGSIAAVGFFGMLVGLATFFVVTLTREESANSKAAFEVYKIEASKVSGALRKETAEANDRAAQAMLALELLKQPRRLTPTQQHSIREKIANFAGQQYSVSISPIVEPTFLTELDKTLLDAGWLRQPPVGPITAAGGQADINTVVGLFVLYAPGFSPQLKGRAEALASALVAEGIAAKVDPSPRLEARPTVIEIMIGAKPLE